MFEFEMFLIGSFITDAMCVRVFMISYISICRYLYLNVYINVYILFIYIYIYVYISTDSFWAGSKSSSTSSLQPFQITTNTKSYCYPSACPVGSHTGKHFLRVPGGTNEQKVSTNWEVTGENGCLELTNMRYDVIFRARSLVMQ